MDICSLVSWRQSMDVGGKTLGTKAVCAAPIKPVFHVFMVEYTQVTQLHQNLYLCSIHKAVSIASLACCCTSEKRRRMTKDVVGHFSGCCLPIFLLHFFSFFFPRPCFSCIFVKYTLQKRGEGWFCLWSLHSPDMLLLTHQCRCSRLLKFVLCMKDGNYAKPLLGQRTTVKSLNDEREHFGLWKQGCKFWQSLKM